MKPTATRPGMPIENQKILTATILTLVMVENLVFAA
jgi:hypothetical protein